MFGCFDFAIDKNGQYIFLEINPQGQWLWGDYVNPGLNQLEAMAMFLMSKRGDFKYRPRNIVRAADFTEEEFKKHCSIEEAEHYSHLMTFQYYQTSFKMETELSVR